MDCSLPGSSFHGIFHARVLEWVAISFSGGSSWPRERTWVSSIEDRCLTIWATKLGGFLHISLLKTHPIFISLPLSRSIMGLTPITSGLESLASLTLHCYHYNPFYMDYFVWKWKLLSHVWLFATSWTIQSMEFSRSEYWSGSSFPSPVDLPNLRIKPRSHKLQVNSLPAEPQGMSKNTGVGSLFLLQGLFLTQELNRGLLHCRMILYQLSYQGRFNSRKPFYFDSDIFVL